MKALISAFALLSFVAATSVPYVAEAQTQTMAPQTMAPHSTAKKATTHKTMTKHVAKAKKTHKVASKAKKTTKKPSDSAIKG